MSGRDTVFFELVQVRPRAVHYRDSRKLHGIACNRYHCRRWALVTGVAKEVTCRACLGVLATRR